LKKPVKKKIPAILHFEIPVDLYHSKVCFLICKDKEGARKFTEVWFESTCEPFKATAYGTTVFKQGYPTVVWLEHFPKTPSDYGALAHETGHAAFVMLRDLGMGFTDDSEEAFTYLQEYLVTEFLIHRDKLHGKNTRT